MSTYDLGIFSTPVLFRCSGKACQKVMPEWHKNEFGVKILFYLSIGDDAQRALKVMPAWHMI